MSRRAILTSASLMGFFALSGTLVSQRIAKLRQQIKDITLPAPVNTLPLMSPGLENTIDNLTPLVTEQEDLYRVDINLAVPIVDVDDWILTIKRKGFPDKRYSYEDILAMELVERDLTLVCVSNTVGGKYNGSGRWLGVPLLKLLEPFNITDGEVNQLFSTSVDGYTSSTALERISDRALLAIGFNGEVLNREHGFPARLLVPGIFGYVGATKWLKTLEVTTFEAKEAYWTKKGWVEDAPVVPQTRIDTPTPFSKIAQETTIAGVAYAPGQGVSQVQVQIDGGSWRNAMVARPASVEKSQDYWVQWSLPVELAPGDHSVAARCITDEGEVQSAVRRDAFPQGASGIQSLRFTVG